MREEEVEQSIDDSQPSTENNTVSKPSNINESQETSDMEVHHHNHPGHHNKKWKEYFLEFLMIFLAVTMGFFAENIREHFGERKKEKQLIASLQKDLKKDTVALNLLINQYIPAHNAWVDSFQYYIDSFPIDGNERRISLGIQNATLWNLYQPPEISLYFLKNSGSFNLIENERVKAEILDYNAVLNNYINYSAFVAPMQYAVDTAAAALLTRNDVKFFLDKALDLLRKGQIGFITITDVPALIKLKNYNKDAHVNFLSKLDQITSKLNDMNVQYQLILERDIHLLKILQEEYPDL